MYLCFYSDFYSTKYNTCLIKTEEKEDDAWRNDENTPTEQKMWRKKVI